MEKAMYGSVLLKAKQILDFLLEDEMAPTLAEISSGIGIPKPTVLKILNTLENINFVRKDASTKKYYLSTQLMAYAQKSFASFDIAQYAYTYLLRLRKETEETINLGILSDDLIILIKKLESPRSVKLHSVIGGNLHLYSSAMGKAALSTFTPKELTDYLKRTDFEKQTEYTITDPDQLEHEVSVVRETQIAIDNEENEKEIVCMGTTIFKHGNLLGLISISTPKYRFNEEKKAKFAEYLLKTKSEIESLL